MMPESATGRVFAALVFGVRGRLYAFEQRGEATLLPWLQRYRPISAAPGLPEWCLGLLNVRGTVQMVADLGYLFGQGRSDTGDSSRLIFIEYGSAQLGLLVDQEIGVRYLRPHKTIEDVMAEPFIGGGALLENEQIGVLNGAAIIHHVAEALRAPAYLN